MTHLNVGAIEWGYERNIKKAPGHPKLFAFVGGALRYIKQSEWYICNSDAAVSGLWGITIAWPGHGLPQRSLDLSFDSEVKVSRRASEAEAPPKFGSDRPRLNESLGSGLFGGPAGTELCSGFTEQSQPVTALGNL
jgi:hypothetical protein